MYRFCPDVHFNTGHSNEMYYLYPFDTCIHSDSGNTMQATFRLVLPELAPQLNMTCCTNIICTGLDVPVMPVQSRCEMARASINTRQADAGVNGNLAVTTLRKEKDIEIKKERARVLTCLTLRS